MVRKHLVTEKGTCGMHLFMLYHILQVLFSKKYTEYYIFIAKSDMFLILSKCQGSFLFLKEILRDEERSELPIQCH